MNFHQTSIFIIFSHFFFFKLKTLECWWIGFLACFTHNNNNSINNKNKKNNNNNNDNINKNGNTYNNNDNKKNNNNNTTNENNNNNNNNINKATPAIITKITKLQNQLVTKPWELYKYNIIDKVPLKLPTSILNSQYSPHFLLSPSPFPSLPPPLLSSTFSPLLLPPPYPLLHSLHPSLHLAFLSIWQQQLYSIKVALRHTTIVLISYLPRLSYTAFCSFFKIDYQFFFISLFFSHRAILQHTPSSWRPPCIWVCWWFWLVPLLL